MLVVSFSSKLDWGSSIISIAKTSSKKIEFLISSVKFVSPEVVHYLYKSILHGILLSRVWDVVTSCYYDMLDNLQKLVFGAVGPTLAASVDSLDYRVKM